MAVSETTQKSRDLYASLLAKDPYMPSIGLYKKGFLKSWYWISYGERAFKLKDLGTQHLKNIIKSQIERHPEADIRPLGREMQRRIIKEKLSKPF